MADYLKKKKTKDKLKTVFQTFFREKSDFFKYEIKNVPFPLDVIIENKGDYIFMIIFK